MCRGAGSSLLQKPRVIEKIVRGMGSVLSCPLTIKVRKGFNDNQDVAHTFLPDVTSWGATAVTLHGRSRQQRYAIVCHVSACTCFFLTTVLLLYRHFYIVFGVDDGEECYVWHVILCVVRGTKQDNTWHDFWGVQYALTCVSAVLMWFAQPT